MLAPSARKRRSAASASVAFSHGADPGTGRFAITLGKALTRRVVAEMPPAGVRVALVAANTAAWKKLQAWASDQMGRTVPDPTPDRRKPGLVAADIENPAYAPDSRARALLRGLTIAEADLQEAGGAFTPDEVRRLLNGVSRQALEKRVKDGSLLAVPGPSNRRRYPAVQFTREGVVPGLKQVQAALPTRNPWAVLNFLVRSDDRLNGRAPIALLREGDVERVVSAARGIGVQGG